MFLAEIDKNRILSFKHLVKRKNQDTETIVAHKNIFSYTTKRGLVKQYVCFDSFGEYKKSEYFPAQPEQVNGFYFVELPPKADT